MGAFILAPDNVRYSAFVWDPTRETWDDFPTPPVLAHCVSQVDGHIAASGNHSPEQPTLTCGDRKVGPHIFVLRPGSRNWTEWGIPGEIRNEQGIRDWARFCAVRIG